MNDAATQALIAEAVEGNITSKHLGRLVGRLAQCFDLQQAKMDAMQRVADENAARIDALSEKVDLKVDGLSSTVTSRVDNIGSQFDSMRKEMLKFMWALLAICAVLAGAEKVIEFFIK